MGSAPFSPPSTSVEIPSQLQRLWRKLNEFQGITPLASGATLPEAVETINAILAKLKGVTKG